MLLKANLQSRPWAVVALATATAFCLFLIFYTTIPLTDLSNRPIKPWATEAQPAPETIPDLAIATFLTGQAQDDTYFNATKLLAYQFLHDPPTKITNPNISFIVLCGNKLPEEKREVLRKMGVVVISVDDVKRPEWIHVGTERWSEQFTKLRLFERTEYKRILYIDADYLIVHPMDGIFNNTIVQHLSSPLLDRKGEIHDDEGPLPNKFLFAARIDNGGVGGEKHDVPPPNANYLNAGFILLAPDKAMYEHLVTVMQIENRYRTTLMEQDMLNYVFRREGPLPWRELDWKWSANFVNEKDIEFGVHSLHGKFWWEGPEYARKLWRSTMDKMEQFVETL